MKEYGCIVIGGGHAGIEAALAAARMGCRTLLLTVSYDTIGQMSCNPAIGGVGKGQLVKEIDALGGEMGLAADRTAIQFRQLNASKGQAVRSSRCQSDRKRYKHYMQEVIRHQSGLDVVEGLVSDILVKNGAVTGVRTERAGSFATQTIVVAAGTFLNGRMHIGREITPGGRVGDPSALQLSKNLKELGFDILSFKTGTPPRLDKDTINFSVLEEQTSDDKPRPFSFRTGFIPPEQKLVSCHITHTNEETHEIIRQNMHLSPMYSGQINSTGVRYCPSIEDKLKKFSDKKSHQVFLEPDGLDSKVYYPNGISTGLPADVQKKMVHSIKGLETARLLQMGYSIEHEVIRPTELTPSLETRKIKNLFLAGQVNGTTGYEEAAAQGMMAGINAVLKIQNKPPFILGRDEAYVGVLIDDLVTKGTEEPYRMFTSRVEYRLVVREDNADGRLTRYGYQFGLIKADQYDLTCRKYEKIRDEIQHLKASRLFPCREINERLIQRQSSPLRQPVCLSDLLKRPEIDYDFIAAYNGKLEKASRDVIDQVEYEIKYEGFISRQRKDIEKFKHIENIKIPADICYENIQGLSKEIQQKLRAYRPQNLGQANRISGVTPAAISVLMIFLKGRGGSLPHHSNERGEGGSVAKGE